jgi:hypothetical protein
MIVMIAGKCWKVSFPTLLEKLLLKVQMRTALPIPRRVANLQKAEHEEQCSSTMLMDDC